MTQHDESNTLDSPTPWHPHVKAEPREEPLDVLFQGIPEPIGVYQKTESGLTLVPFDQAADKMSQGNTGRALGKTIDEIYAAQPGIAQHAYRCLERKQNLTLETKYQLVGTGEDRYVVFSFVYIPDDRVMIHTLDITERVRAEHALRKENQALEQRVTERTAQLQVSQQRVTEILEIIQDGFFSLDREWHLTYLNRRAAGALNLSPEELVGQNLWTKFPQIVGTPIEHVYRQVMTERVPMRLEAPGVITGMLYDIRVYPSADGISIYWVDVTERKRAEEDLRSALQAATQSEERFKSLYQSLPYFAVVFQKRGDEFVMTDHNQAAVAFTQGGIAALVGTTVRETYAERPEIYEPVERAFAEQTTLRQEGPYRLVTTGEEKYIISTFVYVPPDQVLLHIEDITERKRAEESLLEAVHALRESEERFRTVLENSLDAAYRRNLQTDHYDYVSPVIETITGYSAEEFSRLSYAEALQRVHPEDRDHVRYEIEQTLRTHRATASVEYRLLGKDGRYHWLSDNLTTLCDVSGQPLYRVGFVRDVTARRLADERIAALNRELKRHSAELSATNKELESFSYSVSHDLRTPLATIDSLAKLLQDDYGAQLPGAQRYIELIRAGTHQMDELIQSLLGLSRLSSRPIQKQTVDMAALVTQAVEAVQQEREGENITLAVQGLPNAEADPVLLKQVWVNLISNARKFTRKCANPRIEIGCESFDDEERAYYVRDNGVGFDMEQTGRLFRVFQRLHDEAEYEGTGVGLAIVARIIRRHGGRVWAKGEEGRGATFYFTLG